MVSQEWKHQVKVPRENDEVLEVPPDPARENRYPVLSDSHWRAGGCRWWLLRIEWL
jgi:hypothetical protein